MKIRSSSAAGRLFVRQAPRRTSGRNSNRPPASYGSVVTAKGQLTALSLSPRISQSGCMSQTVGPTKLWQWIPTGSFLPAAGTCGAAWSARRPVKPEVAGSNPVRSAHRSCYPRYLGIRAAAGATSSFSGGAMRCGAALCGIMEDRPGDGASGRVAQLVERAPEKREVTGSMPVPTTKNSLVRALQNALARHNPA